MATRDIKEFTALVVDDNPVNRAVNIKYLTKNNFRVKVAENGKVAVDHFRGGDQFDLVIMDMEMPIMDGIEATKEIRTLGVKSIIIGMSAAPSQTKIHEFINAGLDDFHPKPMNMAKLAAIVALLK